MTTIEQALSQPGPLLAVWDDSTKPATLFVYRAEGRLERLAFERDAARKPDPTNADLRRRGVRIGAGHGGELVWSADGGFTVWGPTGVVAEGSDMGLQVGGGRTVRRGEIARVVSFLDEDSLGHRGVKLALEAGGEVVVAEEHDSAAEIDPTYNLDNVMIDGAWATFLGRALAAWLGVPHTDELP